jgi:hypothetical protein
MRYDEALANDVGALEVTKASLEFAPCDEVLRQRDLVIECGALNRIHELLSMATW